MGIDENRKMEGLLPIPLNRVRINDRFWSPMLTTYREVTIHDSFTKFENDRGGALNNFDRVANGKTGYHAGPEWYDGLIYEMIRGASDFLAWNDDPELDRRLDGYIERIAKAAARDPDGYLNTWTQLMAPEQRWGFKGGFLRGQHDVYNAGCMVDAAVHHYLATGKRTLLEVAVKFANHMCAIMGPDKLNVVPAHSQPEEALVKLYRLISHEPDLKSSLSVPVDETEYLALAEYWIENRGNHAGFPNWEPYCHTCLQCIRQQTYGNSRPSWGRYAQDHMPVLDQDSLEGHAVRATLLATGVAAIGIENKRDEYRSAARRLWENMVHKRMHITGGVGSIHYEEQFGPDFYLPNDAYLETCAAVGAGFFHHRMHQLDVDGKYIDEFERILYNGALNGISVAGDSYYYQNPLEGFSHNRWDWHECPCCPPMFLKLMGAFGTYIYSTGDNTAYVNLFVGSEADVEFGGQSITLKQETDYPWEGATRLSVTTGEPTSFALKIRIPGWLRGIENPGGLYSATDNAGAEIKLRIGGEDAPVEVGNDGYLAIEREWVDGDLVELSFPLKIRRIHAHKAVEADRGKVALLSGPFVYCLESVDNPHSIIGYYLKPDENLTQIDGSDDLYNLPLIKGEAWHIQDAGSNDDQRTEITLIPFFLQNNRASNTDFIVWIPESEKVTRLNLKRIKEKLNNKC